MSAVWFCSMHHSVTQYTHISKLHLILHQVAHPHPWVSNCLHLSVCWVVCSICPHIMILNRGECHWMVCRGHSNIIFDSKGPSILWWAWKESSHVLKAPCIHRAVLTEHQTWKKRTAGASRWEQENHNLLYKGYQPIIVRHAELN
jgi:hypothetical protein